MSHHVHMLPGIIPLETPQRTGKRRRLRKVRIGQLGQAGRIDETGDVDEEFYLLPDSAEDEADQEDSRGSRSGARFTTETMTALLAVQERR